MYILLFIFFVILNGKITTEIILFGLGLTLLIGLLMKALFDYDLHREIIFLKKTPLFMIYVYVLLREIVIANMNMIHLIVSPNQQFEPTLVKIHSGLKSKFANYVLANSITLTPGTITVSVEDDLLTVHCISREFLDITTFVSWLERMEG